MTQSGGICMLKEDKGIKEFKVEAMFTQEEVNHMIRQRLTRAKRGFDREFEYKMLQIEVLGRLKKENIPTSFAQFIMLSKNQKRTRKTLEQFIKVWRETKK